MNESQQQTTDQVLDEQKEKKTVSEQIHVIVTKNNQEINSIRYGYITLTIKNSLIDQCDFHKTKKTRYYWMTQEEIALEKEQKMMLLDRGG